MTDAFASLFFLRDACERTQQTLKNVLEGCGDNLDEAIRSLQALKIAAGQCEERLSAAKNVVQDATAKHLSSAGDENNASTMGERVGSVSDERTTSDFATGEGENPCPQRTADEWVDIVVGEMSRSADMEDAKKRAANVLGKFEQDVIKIVGVERERVRQLLEENNILKRAVAIQNQRMAESAGKDKEIEHLRHLLTQCQDHLHKAEMNQYALALHLRQATGENTLGEKRIPDVY